MQRFLQKLGVGAKLTPAEEQQAAPPQKVPDSAAPANAPVTTNAAKANEPISLPRLAGIIGLIAAVGVLGFWLGRRTQTKSDGGSR